jgi:PhoPQ-activated pathogenicity-related protein
MRLWTADSATRDFRLAAWSDQTLDIKPGSTQASAVIKEPAGGYRAFMGEVRLRSLTGHQYRLSTEVQVLPDDVE